jgi:hypothetical protein
MAMSVTEENQATAFAEGTRTGNWFAMGDVAHDPLLDVPPSDVRQVPTLRRTIVRVIGCLLIGGTVACVVRLATHPPAREAILRWGFFGQSERILPSATR